VLQQASKKFSWKSKINKRRCDEIFANWWNDKWDQEKKGQIRKRLRWRRWC